MSPRAMAAPLTISESTTPFNTKGYVPLRLGGASLGSAASYSYKNDIVSYSGIAGNDGVVKGTMAGAYSAPVTDALGDRFGGKYLSTGEGGYINIAFATPQQSLSLLWGSIDPSNRITLLNGTTIVAVVEGADIAADANGSQGIGGSLYVLLNSAVAFNDVEFSSGVPSFELARFRTDPADVPVHEPASLALFGSGLLGLVGLRRRL